MSSTALPITPARFALALRDLPLPSLHLKAAELRNSLAHLRHSNEQLRPFAAEGDVDCADAIAENEEVMGRMRERVELLRQEVLGRGIRWVEWDEEGAVEVEDGGAHIGSGEDGAPVIDGIVEEAGVNGVGTTATATAITAAVTGASGSLTDEELARRIRAQMGDGDEDEEGMHL